MKTTSTKDAKNENKKKQWGGENNKTNNKKQGGENKIKNIQSFIQ